MLAFFINSFCHAFTLISLYSTHAPLSLFTQHTPTRAATDSFPGIIDVLQKYDIGKQVRMCGGIARTMPTKPYT